MVGLERLSGGEDTKSLQAIIYHHLEATESKKAKEILAQWETTSAKFWKVIPHPPVSTLPPAQTQALPIAAKV
jgi:glutamate synthase (NADPH/NADH) large chain/glutamate synthase (ferredoxin)